MAKTCTLSLDETIQQEFKHSCILRGVSMSKRIQELMSFDLKEDNRRVETLEKELQLVNSKLSDIVNQLNVTLSDNNEGVDF